MLRAKADRTVAGPDSGGQFDLSGQPVSVARVLRPLGDGYRHGLGVFGGAIGSAASTVVMSPKVMQS